METQKQIFGLVERDLTRGVYIGKIIGFPHIEFEATTFGDVVSKLQAPPRHNRCRLLRTQEHGGGDEGFNWHVSDNHSRIGQ
jgi:hypothetical protein